MRDKITNFLETCESAPAAMISKHIAFGEYEVKRECNRMVAEGIIVLHRRGNVSYYGIAANFTRAKERIIQFLKKHPGVSAKIVADGANVEPAYAGSVLVDLHKAGRATRYSHPVTKVWLYTHTEQLTFGCGNPLTAMFNDYLRSVREARA